MDCFTVPPHPTCFGHLWGNFCLNKYRKNIQPKTISKQPKKYLQIISKLPQNYPKSFGIGEPPPPFSSVMSKRRPKKTAPKLLYYGWTPQSRMSNIFRDLESLGKSNGKKWSHIQTFLLQSCLKSPRKKKLFFFC